MNIQILNQLQACFRASLPVIALDSPAAEEQSVLGAIAAQVANPLGLPLYRFDNATGMQMLNWHPEAGLSAQPFTKFVPQVDPLAEVIEFIRQADDHGIFVICDIHPYMGQDPMRLDYSLIRRLKNLVFDLKQSRKRVVLLGQNIRLTDELQGLVYELHQDLPNITQIQTTVHSTLADLEENYQPVRTEFCISLSQEELLRLCRCAQGLTLGELSDALRLAAVSHGRIDAASAELINGLKIQKLRRLNVDFCDTPDVSVGGLDNLKDWLKKRSKQFSAQVQNTKLPAPKGLMLVGVPGSGKSLIAKTIGHLWGIPILSVDMGTVYSSLVGESEANLRQLLKTAEAIAPCVLMMDEVEKALAGNNADSTDSGVSQRLFGKILSWMSDKKAPVFVVATANNIAGLPPEFTRKGRFDEVFFVDLPNAQERRAILEIHLAKYGATLDEAVITKLVELTREFSGAEIAAAVNEAALAADDEERFPDITVADLTLAVSQTVPLSRRNPDQITALRKWAEASARNASIPEVVVETINSKRNKVEML
jgi:SpoVK/Ycf46/Vps4 family AAA+-type ATPase